jgi:hypothetical protein
LWVVVAIAYTLRGDGMCVCVCVCVCVMQ